MARTLERLRTQYAAKPGDMQKGPRQGPPGRGMTGKPKNAGQTIKRLMGYVGKYWYRLVLVLLCMLITTVTRKAIAVPWRTHCRTRSVRPAPWFWAIKLVMAAPIALLTAQ